MSGILLHSRSQCTALVKASQQEKRHLATYLGYVTIKERAPEFRGLSEVSEVLPVRLELYRPPGPDNQDYNRNHQDSTNDDYCPDIGGCNWCWWCWCRWYIDRRWWWRCLRYVDYRWRHLLNNHWWWRFFWLIHDGEVCQC